MPQDRNVIKQFCFFMNDVLGRIDRLEARAQQSETSIPLAVAGVDSSSDALLVTESDIRAAYRLILGRDADANGLRDYLDRAKIGTLSLDELVHTFRDSDEYIARRARQLTTVDVDGLQVAIDPDEPEFGRAIARDGVWEAHIMQQIAANLRPGEVFVDIGANVGIMSFVAARIVGDGGKVIAFEPNPDNIQFFLQGVLLNAFAHVTLFPLAASSASGVFAIRGRSNTYVSEAKVGGRLVQSIEVDTLLCREPRIDLIKIDIEGHEPHALTGLANTLERHKPLLLCEFNPRCLQIAGADPNDFAAYIFTLSKSVEIIAHDGALVPVHSSYHLMDLWRGRNSDHINCGDLADGMVHFDLLMRTK